MRMMRTSLLIATGALALAACSKKAPPELPPPPAGETTTSEQGDTSGMDTGIVPGSQADFVAKVSSDRIFFDTDKYNVDSQDQMTLQSQARWLSQYPSKQVIVEGHADERGTRDYNLALGERRANAAKNYLVTLGIAPSRIRVVSYGKEQPDALGATEEAWARNRRAVTVTVD